LTVIRKAVYLNSFDCYSSFGADMGLASIDSDTSALQHLSAASAPARAAAFLQGLPPYPATFSGRGIVICAGGVRYLTCAWVLINVLRRLGCTLPIEVWYLGKEEGDPCWIALAEPLGVRCVDAREVSLNLPIPHPRLDGWESKAFAILHCPFEEVLLLDADNVPVVDPTFLFDTSEYRACGAVFWPDFNRMGPEHAAWRVFGVPYRDEWEQESGQIVIDKRRGWPALCLCDWYNRHSDFYYRHVYGDKDTFRFAWNRVGIPFAMAGRIGQLPYTICQGDFQRHLLFQHRVGDKWSLRGNRRIPGFQREATCVGFVRALSVAWTPLAGTLRMHARAGNAVASRLVRRGKRIVRAVVRRHPIRMRGAAMSERK
jgi:hypothetical protein